VKLLIVFAQRKESYPGEYAPEAHAVITEHDHEESPEYIEGQLAYVRAIQGVVAATIFDVDLGSQAIAQIRARLLDPAKIEGKII
jgi:hypothetical protein